MRWRRACGVAIFAALVCAASSASPGESGQSEYAAALEEARTLIIESRFEQALEFVELALVADPEGLEAVRMASLCYWQLGRHGDGLPHVLKLIELSPREPEARLFGADFYGALGRPADRLAALGSALRLAPEHPGARRRLVEMSAAADASLVEAFEVLAQQIPENLDARVALATMYRRHGRLVEALERLRSSLSIAPDRAFEVHREIALIYADVRAWEETANHLERALKAAPSDAAALFTKAMMHSRRGEAEQAARLFQLLLKQTPDNAMLHFRLGEVFDSNNRADEAEASYLRALKSQPTPAGAFFRLGKLYLDAGDPGRARPLLQRAVERDPRRAESHLELAHVFDRLNDPKSARTHYQRALALSPSFALAHRSLGNFEMRHGDNVAGRAALLRFQDLKAREKQTEGLLAEVDSHPEDFDAKHALIDHLLAGGEFPLALRLAQRYLLSEAAPTHYALLGTVHLSMKDGEGASRLFEQAVRLAPQSEAAHRRLAEAYLASGRSEEAARAQEQADAIARTAR